MHKASSRPTAAALIIGSEILNGKTHDVNTLELGKFCFATGLRLRRVEIVEDDFAAIQEACDRLAPVHSAVFTSGGIGSTHDDITYKAIAKWWGKPLELHAPTAVKMKQHLTNMQPAALRMATFPASAEVQEVEGLWVPLVTCANIHILPGVPFLFKKMLWAQQARFATNRVLTRRTLWTREGELDIADCMREIQQRYSGVEIGSYPFFSEGRQTHVMISCEGESADLVDACLSELLAKVSTCYAPNLM